MFYYLYYKSFVILIYGCDHKSALQLLQTSKLQLKLEKDIPNDIWYKKKALNSAKSISIFPIRLVLVFYSKLLSLVTAFATSH